MSTNSTNSKLCMICPMSPNVNSLISQFIRCPICTHQCPQTVTPIDTLSFNLAYYAEISLQKLQIKKTHMDPWNTSSMAFTPQNRQSAQNFKGPNGLRSHHITLKFLKFLGETPDLLCFAHIIHCVSSCMSPKTTGSIPVIKYHNSTCS